MLLISNLFIKNNLLFYYFMLIKKKYFNLIF